MIYRKKKRGGERLGIMKDEGKAKQKFEKL
jgi:hypothetical protein